MLDFVSLNRKGQFTKESYKSVRKKRNRRRDCSTFMVSEAPIVIIGQKPRLRKRTCKSEQETIKLDYIFYFHCMYKEQICHNILMLSSQKL